MKKILLAVLGFMFMAPAISQAQDFTVTSDTVFASVTTTATVFDNITNTTSGTLTLKWHVVATNFPTDWLNAGFGICDNALCRYNTGGELWDTSTSSGSTLTSSYGSGLGEFALSLDLTSATTTGTYYMTVTINEPSALYSKNVVFVIGKYPTSVANVNNEDGVSLYPNPARNDVNIIYSANANVKSIAVYNMIGKAMTAYKVSSNTSANLDIQKLPSGIYFVRLFNAEGNIVATRKFTKQ